MNPAPRSGSPRLQRRCSHPYASARIVLLVVALFAPAPAAHAVVRSCGPDALANTAIVLCAPPSGPCDATTVTVGAAIELTDGMPCTFDLGGRALVITRAVQATGRGGGVVGEIVIHDVGDVTITPTGKLKARGDFVEPFGFIVGGGVIVIRSQGAITNLGSLDVSGDPAGELVLRAAGAATLGASSAVLGNGISTFLEEGERFADGGVLDLIAGGDIRADGALSMTGQGSGDGGQILLTTPRSVAITRKIDLAGGALDGGGLDVVAGDDITLRGGVDADSRSGGGFGGSIDLSAGADLPGDLVPGGRIDVSDATFTLRGSNGELFSGDGGDLDFESAGPNRLTRVVVRVDAGSGFDGFGGTVYLSSGDALPGLSPRDGDLLVDATISARSSRGSGSGGDVFFDAGRNLRLTGSVDVGGKEAGGAVFAAAGGALRVEAPLTANAFDRLGDGGTIDLAAGFETHAPLSIARNLSIAQGAASGLPGELSLAGCTLTVEDGVKLDGRGVTSGGAEMRLLSVEPMRLGAGSQYLAGPSGTVTTIHLAGADPIIGPGVVFQPARSDEVRSIIFDPPCPPAVCGNGVPESGEQCDDGNLTDGDGCSATCTVQCTAAPAAGCRRPVAPGKAQLTIENRDQNAKDRLAWRWLKGAATSVTDLGDPVLDDDYAFCVYDESGTPLRLAAAAPGGGTCAGHLCWKAIARGFAYDDPERTPAGLDTMTLEAGADGEAAIAVTGRGETLALPLLPLALPVRAQLQSTHGTCWEATFAAATKNDGVRFEAVGD